MRGFFITIAAQPTYTEDQVVRIKVPWSAYESLVESLGDLNRVRLTYDGEYLEIMSPGSLHDFFVQAIGDMLASVRLVWRVQLAGYRTTTFRVEQKNGGFEGDLAYYVGETKTRLRDRLNVNIATDPPPDLVVEVDITNRSTDKFAIFTRLGVPEVWHYTPKEDFVWFGLEGGAYVPIATSRIIAGLPLVEVSKRLARAKTDDDDVAFFTEWEQWLRDNRHLHDDLKQYGKSID